ncbi:MAG: hypothetical protein HY903_08590 [Deltaproteobacteria bacterium]|nr:hypothetical protein [Deltaproteobacteria bacterium]
MRNRSSMVVLWASTLGACMSGGDRVTGLAAANPHDAGPGLVWDMFAEPFPEVPFPNDIGTRADATSPTGLRVNVSRNAATAHERKLRRLLDGLDGFGTYSPLWVRFDARINLVDLFLRHADLDFTNDAVYVVNLNPKSKSYGQPMLLDFGHGRFPLALQDSDNYFLNDPRSLASNLMLETEAETDANGNGVLDPEEDSDDDGVLDRPNLWGTITGDPSRMDRYRDLVTFYELETDTLIVRTALPREERSTYAVILTRRIVGDDSQSPIRSPFEVVNHVSQTAALRPLVEDRILDNLGIGLGDIAFAWTFTTESITQSIETVRAGLYGIGPMARLAAEFPPRLSRVPPIDVPEKSDSLHLLKVDRLFDALSKPAFLQAVSLDPTKADVIFSVYRQYVDSLLFAELESPAFIDNADGTLALDPATGNASYGRDTVYLVCSVPKVLPGRQAPFPVVLYSHGYTSSRFEFLGFAGSLGRLGLATCCLDAYGHGLPSSDLIIGMVKALLKDEKLELLADAITNSRARDLNGDGASDSGGDFWTANTFHTRDVVRQSTIDYLQTIRVLRNFGKTTMPLDQNGDGQDDVAGDFDGDGVPEIGGEQPYYVWGQSLGGILSAVIGPLEPMVTATAPTAGGGGLVDLGLRSTQGGVVQAVFLPLFGPLIAGTQVGTTNRIDIKFDVLDVNKEREVRFAQVPDLNAQKLDEIAVGDRVRVTNLDNGEIDTATIHTPAAGKPPGLFQLHIAADYGDRVKIELFRAGAETPYRVIDTFETADLSEVGFQGKLYNQGDTLRTLQEGFGLRRNTPAFRRLFSVAQMVVDPADPVNHARLYAEPLDLPPEGRVPTGMLNLSTVGDMNVPVNTGIAMARAAGLLGIHQEHPVYGKTEDDVLIDNYVIEGLEDLNRFAASACHYDPRGILFDIDETSQGLDPEAGPRLSLISRAPFCDGSAAEPASCRAPCVAAPPLRPTKTYPWGQSGLRIPYVKNTGKHGFEMPDPTLAFDSNTYLINQLGWYFKTNGAEIVDDVCLATTSCSFLVH